MTLAVNAQGQITSLFDQPISIPASAINTTIPNSGLTNSSVTIGSSSLSLGGTLTTLVGVSISGSTNTLSNIGNSSLTNSSITINGSAISLGGTVSVGTVTSVSGTANEIAVATGTTTPVISLPSAITLTGKTITGGTYSSMLLGSNLDTNGYNIIGGNFGGNQLALPVGFGPFLQGLYEGNVNLRAGTTGAASAGLTLTSNGALGLGTSPSYGSAGQVLTSGGSGATATWSTPAANVSSFQTSLSGLTPSTATTGAVTLAGTLGETSGGTNQTTYTTGDILYASASNTLSKLPIGSAGQLLTVTAGIPAWGAAPATGVTSFSAGTTGFTPATATTGAVTLAGTLAIANGGTNGTAAPTAGGVSYGTGTAYAFTAAGTAGQVLTSNGASAPAWAASPGATITATSTNASFFPTFNSSTSGSFTVANVNANFTHNPGTGDLSAPQHVSSNGLVINSTTVGTSYTVAAGQNAMSVGPMTVSGGVVVTITSGQRWVVL
jgi:hypothetical protein